MHTSLTTQANLDTWISTFKIPFTTLRDPDGAGQRIVSDFSPREHLFIVDLPTMKILYDAHGYDELQGAFDKLDSL